MSILSIQNVNSLNIRSFQENAVKNRAWERLYAPVNLSGNAMQPVTDLRQMPVYYPLVKEAKNQTANIVWSSKFDEAFKEQNTEKMLSYINNHSVLKPLFPATTNNDLRQKFYTYDEMGKEYPISALEMVAHTKPHDIKVTARRSGHVQIESEYLGKLFVNRTDLMDTDLDNVSKRIIEGGARGFDPFDQDDWPKVIGRVWPPADETIDSNGVTHLSYDKSGQSILMNTSPKIGQSYQTHPQGLTILDSENNSIIMAFQQENHNPSVDFGAWSILPFRIRPGKRTIAIFPIENRSSERYADNKGTDVKEMHESSQWNLEKNSNFFIVDASKPSNKSEYIDPDADWCMFATEGDDTVCLIRSCYKDKTDDKQFKVFSGKESTGGTKYIELEFIAPKVKAGQKSTLVYRIDFISLKKMQLPNLTKDNLNDTMKQAALLIDKKIDYLRNSSKL
ncbi:MAG: hypothetical protein AB7V50_08060 [Vampirovibrionia bacterium]